MSTVSIEQINVIIARFENRKFFGKYTIDEYGPHHGLKYPEMKYHTSWDWLHPVWEKFRDLDFKNSRHRRWNHENHKEAIEGCMVYGTVAECQEALYNGIRWYNTIMKIDTTKTNP